MTVSTQDFLRGSAVSIHYSSDNIEDIVDKQTPSLSRGLIIETVDDVGGNPEVPNPDADSLDRLSRYIWKRVGSSSISMYYWDDFAVSDSIYLKWSTFEGGGTPVTENPAPLGQPISSARLINPNRSITVGFIDTSSTISYVSGDSFPDSLYKGDILRYNGTNYTITAVSATIATITPAFSGVSGNFLCDFVGFGIIPSTGTHSIIPMKITAVSTGAVAWAGTFTALKFKITDGTEVAELLSTDLGSAFSNDMADGAELSVNNSGGMGDEFYQQGLSAEIMNGGTHTSLSAGSSIRVMVQGIKYEGQFSN